jgi:Xaa-Pro aminopeptidase
MDFGAEYANYASDATRVIPVSGKFTQRQKQVYEAVLRVLKQTTKLIITGTTILEYQEQTKLYIQEELLHLGLIKQHDITKTNQR